MATAEELLEAIRDQGDRGIALITEMQAVAAAQREANRIAIERLGAAQGSDPQRIVDMSLKLCRCIDIPHHQSTIREAAEWCDKGKDLLCALREQHLMEAPPHVSSGSIWPAYPDCRPPPGRSVTDSQ